MQATDTSVSNDSRPSLREQLRPTVLAVEFEVRGHHADYVRNFAMVWLQQDLPANLCFLLSYKFQQLHADVVEYLHSLGDPRISVQLIDEQEQARLDRNRRLRYLVGWELFCKYAKLLHADHGLLMYSDYFQLPVCIGQKSPCDFSAIYFRPTFHYATFPNHVNNWKQRFTALRKKWLLRWFLKNERLKELFCLDPLSVDYIQKHFSTKARISKFADAFFGAEAAMNTQGQQERVEAIRRELGIEPSRVIYSLIGVLDSRKGPRKLIEAVNFLPEAVGKNICLLLLGYLPDGDADGIEALAQSMNGKNGVQIVLKNQYISSDRYQDYHALSDVILTTYQYHIGSSSALIRSCVANRPVLSSDYGLMGELVRRLGLGMVVDSSSPQEIAKGIVQVFESDRTNMMNRENAQQFIRQNLSDELGRDLARLMNHLTPAKTTRA